jgi:iron(III) transport system substrate-binding protein
LLVFAGEAKPAGQDEWNQVVNRARGEGQVVLGTTLGLPSFRQGITEAFLRRFGFNVQFRVFAAAELAAVAVRECAVGRPSLDVLLGGLGELITVYPKGCLAPAKPSLISPEVVNNKGWQGGFLKWNDPEGQYLLQTGEGIYGWTVINTNQIKPEAITSAKDLLKPEYTGKIASFDPRVAGAGQGRAAYILAVLGEEYLNKLYLEQKVIYTSNANQLVEWIARGVYSIGLGAVERLVEPMRQEGLPIGVIPPLNDAPGYLTGGSSVLKLVKDVAHPNAATVLLNWLASKEAQEIYSRSVLQPSRRNDVNVKEVPHYLFPKPGIKYLDTYEYDYYAKKRPDAIKALLKLLGR